MNERKKKSSYGRALPLSNEQQDAKPKKSPSATTCYDVIILGAGASGLMCARSAAARGKRVALIDHNEVMGRKITVSGGGKANFTNKNMGSAFYVGAEPNFVEQALEHFPPQSMIECMSQWGLAWEEREHGQLFGLAPAQSMVDAMVEDCQQGQCYFFLSHEITSVEKKNSRFFVQCAQPEALTLSASSLVLALGSPAWPQLGAGDKGLTLAKQWGHKSTPFHPVLTPLVMPRDWPLQTLSGISLPVEIHTEDYTRCDHLLFTHTGISGPAVLQLSCRWQKGQPIRLNFMPHASFTDMLDAAENGKLQARTLACRYIPQRLADALLPPDMAKRKVAELSRAARTALADAVHKHVVTPTGLGDMRKAEAAAGGVRTNEINAWTMESLKEPGLFIIGELLDITGHLGGYNLHWAFASGSLSGNYV